MIYRGLKMRPHLLNNCGQEILEPRLFAKLVGLQMDKVNEELIFTLEKFRTATVNPAIGRKDIQNFVGNMLLFHGEVKKYRGVLHGLYRELVGDPKEILG